MYFHENKRYLLQSLSQTFAKMFDVEKYITLKVLFTSFISAEDIKVRYVSRIG